MTARRLAAVFGFAGVLLGAFGRHWLGDRLNAGAVQTWHTSTLYHLVHAAAMLGTGDAAGQATKATLAFAAGIALFSGSLYLLAYTGKDLFGLITVVGGVTLLVGWILLFLDKN